EEVLAAAGAILHPVEHLVGGRAAAAADRVVAAELVLDDGEDRPGNVGIEPVAGGQEDTAGGLRRVGRVEALLRVGGVVAKEIDRLLALEVGDAQHLALSDDARPGRAGWNDRVHRMWKT